MQLFPLLFRPRLSLDRGIQNQRRESDSHVGVGCVPSNIVEWIFKALPIVATKSKTWSPESIVEVLFGPERKGASMAVEQDTDMQKGDGTG